MSASSTSSSSAESMTVTRRVSAAPAAIFTVLVDPSTHADVHGTGTESGTETGGRIGRVDGALDSDVLTRAGQRFRMAMYHEPSSQTYETINEVLVYEPSSAIAWCTGYVDADGVAHFGGWLWRYDLAPADGSATDVTLTYDWSAATREARDVIDFPPFGPKHLEESLAHLDGIVASKRS